MNAALYHSYCNRPTDATRLAEKSVAAYRKVLELENNAEKYQANFIEKLYWQARFERASGNQEKFKAIDAEAKAIRGRFPANSPYHSRLEQSRTNILGK